MINIKVSNCNNISTASICLEKNRLNIRYAMNGTGKSTIAKTIELVSKNESLSILKTFDSDIEPNVTISETINKVLLFNEEFVNTIVFKESEVIQNAFDIFIKTPEYELKQSSIDDKLKKIHVNTRDSQEIISFLAVGQNVLSKFSLTTSGELKQTGLIKSLTNVDSIFSLPDKIKKFQPLMDKDYNVDWVGWKNEGSKFDDNHICPFCTENLGTNYSTEKQIFSSSYTKSNVKNIKEMISHFDAVSDYMNEIKSDMLYKCIKETADKDTVNLWIKKFYDELNFIVKKIKNISEFNSYKVKREDISNLDEQLTKLLIDTSCLEIFNNEKVKEFTDTINEEINSIIANIKSLKSDIGNLKGLISSATEKAVSDINEFLNMAGINYSLEINHESDKSTKTILKYISKHKNHTPIENIKLHLSWGERNAFALVLFMHYALSKNPDLIILDDPISSFDSNKKYAIINRLFVNNQKKSLHKKTVLMLTHDFQPVIDFVTLSKPNGEHVSAYFLQNKDGIVSEIKISDNDIKSLPILLSENASNQSLNKIHRITSLRKLLEHTKTDQDQNLAYNLLSCLLHGKDSPTYSDETPITFEDIVSGEDIIKKHITDFNYLDYKNNIFTKDQLKTSFLSEDNSYFKLQVFRVIIAIMKLRSKIDDDPLLKYIDEQFHVENDYIFYLDLNKYDIVPSFVMPKCEEFLHSQKYFST